MIPAQRFIRDWRRDYRTCDVQENRRYFQDSQNNGLRLRVTCDGGGMIPGSAMLRMVRLNGPNKKIDINNRG